MDDEHDAAHRPADGRRAVGAPVHAESRTSPRTETEPRVPNPERPDAFRRAWTRPFLTSRPASLAPAPPPLRPAGSVLALVAVTGAGGVLITACGGGDEHRDRHARAPAGRPRRTPAAPRRPSPESGRAAAGGLVATAEVPVGGGVILEKQKVVVTQPTEGTFKAFSRDLHAPVLPGLEREGRHDQLRVPRLGVQRGGRLGAERAGDPRARGGPRRGRGRRRSSRA